MNNAFKIQFTLIQIWDIFSFIKRRALILAVLNFKCLFFMTFFRYIFHDFWVVAAHIYMDICTALFSQLTIALYVLLKEHFSITESLASLFFFFFFGCRYSIVQGIHLKRLFSINEHNGTIITTEPLDREIASWHNITVTATETSE